MKMHRLEPAGDTLHGYFSRDMAPALTIDSGDVVRFTLLDAGWGLESPRDDGTQRRKADKPNPEHDTGHALCGPVAVRGAKPGSVLQIDILELIPGSWGWNSAGGRPDYRSKPLGLADQPEIQLRWSLDAASMTATDHMGHSVALRPFLGVMGMPPGEAGNHPTSPPRLTGGNIDCRELVQGTTLYLPIEVEGGLFSTGDGHGAQGDGELSGTAIECPMERADLRLTVRDDFELPVPAAWTPDAWLTFGFDEDLDQAQYDAANRMIDLLAAVHDVDRRYATALASVAVDFRVTQVVNGVKGVHAVLAHGAVR